ncbi:MAG: large conductance mechanosensitive channel protein MscL [Candidatus Limivicinus sp.]|nr:large conductance mechanosensitive channel protein MscL [Clostridiales bacterium]MDY6133189.1 large conductance mechanosensitive channel protein MscL [Candidatus Limivicinus sp.]
MKKLISEFKAFIMRGNVLDMAIGVVIAGAFGKITTSLVNDLILPLVSWICGTRDMTALNILVRPAVYNEAGEVVKEAITLGFGSFVGTVIDFLLIALVVFAIVKVANKAHDLAHKKEEATEEAAPEEPPKPTSEELLAQILEELKKK